LSATVRFECLDGLRGWAAIMVVFSHLRGQFARHVDPFYDHPLLRVISDGHLAVLIFFVLSGVALSLRFAQSRQPVSLVGLIVSRYVRLVIPILVTTLIVHLLISWHFSGSVEAARIGNSEIFFGPRRDQGSSLANVLSFSFYSVFFNYDPSTSFNWSLWTMPVEFKGSLLIFGLLFLFSRVPGITRTWRLAMVCALTTFLLIFSTQFFACFTAGYVLAELVHAPLHLNKWLRMASLGLVAASFGIAAGTGQKNDTSDALQAIGVVMAALFWPLMKRFLSTSLSVWLGRVSFPLYLIHMPVIAAAGSMYLTLHHNALSAPVAVHATVILAFIACILSSVLLLPVEQLSVRLSREAGHFKSETGFVTISMSADASLVPRSGRTFLMSN
jgi:peptidoglycan/LPS O-acetylase OafA/YrhL